MWNRNPYVVGVVSSLLATLVMSAASAVLDARFSTGLVFGIVAVAVIAGLATFSALLLRQKKQIDRDLERLEVASWPDWMRAIGLAAREVGIKVFREGGSVIFENAAGERHLLAAGPAGRELGQVLECQRALEVLEGWGCGSAATVEASASSALRACGRAPPLASSASISRWTRSSPLGNAEGPAPGGTGPVRPSSRW